MEEIEGDAELVLVASGMPDSNAPDRSGNMYCVADGPWWLDWRRLPPSMERRMARPSEPLSRRQLWIARLTAPVLFAFGVTLGVVFGSWGAMGAVVAVTIMGWLRMLPAHRRQVLGRSA